ncbi:DUF4214 domain-containing protein [Hominifimenecus sp. rT4P-3]|uniref:DUF4214 domain-containing protein n=1 Tax=Hominifimenecus sp. rT4P-3 TaxID=3242979 RepID=UPI003DA4452D
MRRKWNLLCAFGLSIVMTGTTVFASPLPDVWEEGALAAQEVVETSTQEEQTSVEIQSSESASQSEQAESTEVLETDAREAEEETEAPQESPIETEAVVLDEPTLSGGEEAVEAPMYLATAEEGVTGFVTRLYKIVLQRTPRADEVQFWVDRLKGNQASGSEVAAGFFNSDEYKKRNKSDEAFVTDLYQAIMGRQPDATGYNGWVGRLKDGGSRPNVLAGFLNSEEFRKLCGSYGVQVGSYSYSENRDRNQQATAFVQRLYQIVMGRNGDEGGLNSWTSVLLDQGETGAGVAYGFFFSKEYKSRNKSNDAFVTDLYKAILNRNPDAGGKALWISRLEDGMSRYGVFAGVVNSQEFGQLCEKYGIQRGSYSSPEPRDQNADVTAFVQRLYRNVLGRNGDEGGLNNWTSALNQGGNGTEVAAAFILSEEYRNKSITLSDYVEMLYQTLLNRKSDAAGKASWVDQVRNRTKSPADLIPAFTGSVEFGKLCARYGIQTGAGISVRGDFPKMIIYDAEGVPELLGLVNQARAEAGVKPLVSSDYLNQIALQRAKEIVNDFSHDGLSKYGSFGENIAYGYPTSQAVFQGWMGSAGHRANILRANYGTIGCARYGNYWVQIFSW